MSTAASLLTGGLYAVASQINVWSTTQHPSAPVGLTEGFNAPNLIYQITDGYGNAEALSASTVIGIVIHKVGANTPIINKIGASQGCTITSASDGIIQFSWANAGTFVPPAGEYEMQWIVDGTPYPFDSRIRLSVQGDL